MAYQALYRRWRPETFAQMVGQEHIVQTLKNQIMSNHVAHAYLFCGSRGTGKTSTAKIMARAINCETPADGDACLTCPTCVALGAQTDLDILEIDAASNNGVDEIRDLRDKVKYPPQYGRYKVYIIDEVHMLSTAAFNALLKTLEEPPEHAVFILATTEPQKLPATVLSRCQRFDFGRFTAAQIAGRLKEAADGANVQTTPEALMMIARAAEGGMRDAMSILDIAMSYEGEVTEDVVRRVLGTADKAFMFSFSNALREADLSAVIRLIDRLMRDGKEPQVFLQDVGRHIRALLVAKASQGDLEGLLEITGEDAQAYIKEGEGFSEQRLIRLLDLFADTQGAMRYASSPRIALEVACIKACTQTKETDGHALGERIEALEKEIDRLKSAMSTGEFVQKAAKPKEDRPPAPARTAAAPSDAGPRVNLGDAQAWDEAKKELRKVNPSMYANLISGDFVGVFQNVFRYAVKKDQSIFLGLLNKEANKKQMSEILTRLTGKDVAFEAVMESEKPDVDAIKRENSVMEALRETFGMEKVQLKDE